MQMSAIANALRTRPFQPFLVRMADGRAYPVRHPEFAWLHPGSQRTLIVAEADGGDGFDILDAVLVASLDFEAPEVNGDGG